MRRNTHLGKNPRSWVTSFCNQGLSRGRDLWYLHARQCVNSGFVSRGETFPGSTTPESEIMLQANPILVVFDDRTSNSILASLSRLTAVVAEITIVESFLLVLFSAARNGH